jgi:acetylornithine deacetylase/succinyl-diaminopimelate desuccinylase-like protein
MLSTRRKESLMKTAQRLALLGSLFVIAGWTSCGSGTQTAGPNPPPFDANRAFGFLQEQVGFGARAPGTPGHEQTEAYLFTKLQSTARRAFKQEFTASTLFGGPYDFANLIGLYGPTTGGKRLMLCAHWDTRPAADEDPDPARTEEAILGANDGASGVAVLLEMAQAFAAQPPKIPVIIAFWDAEDSGKSGGPGPYYGYLLGSEYFAKNMPVEATPDEVILLDMVGGDSVANPRVGTRSGGNNVFDLPIERNSNGAAPELVDEVYSAAAKLGHSAFKQRTGYSVIDDHMPFINAGIPAIDLIEFDYPEWHTTDDTPDHCDADSLRQVGEALLAVIYARG